MPRPKAPGGTHRTGRGRRGAAAAASSWLERGVRRGAEALPRGGFNGAAGGGAGRAAAAAAPASGLGPAAKAHTAPRPRQPGHPERPRLRIPGGRCPAPPPSRARAPERRRGFGPGSAPGALGCCSAPPAFAGWLREAEAAPERSRTGAGMGKSRHKQGTTFSPSPSTGTASAGAGPGLGSPGPELG